MISGKSVTVETSLTGTPAAFRVCAVPPIEMRSTPAPTRALAKSISPVLSDTEIRARLIFVRVIPFSLFCSLLELAKQSDLENGPGHGKMGNGSEGIIRSRQAGRGRSGRTTQ